LFHTYTPADIDFMICPLSFVYNLTGIWKSRP
jgi:hypothetical protein